ncbi:MAG: sterol desaturase family protein [Byssovorax sp.]
MSDDAARAADPVDSIDPGEPAEEERSIHERKRAEIVARIPAWYSPALHLAVPSLFGLACLVFAATQIRGVQPIELLTIPLTLLAAFGFEFRVHMWVLHRRMPGLGLLYDRHELEHHVIYTYDDLAMRDRRELRLILMPAYAVFLVAAINTPLALLLWKVTTPTVSELYLVTSMIFFLGYEWLHCMYHLPTDSFIGRRAIIGLLREHHRRHHDPRLMKHWNFNVTLPLFDWLHGTTWSKEREAARAARRKARARQARTA